MPPPEKFSAYALSTNSRISKRQKRYLLPEEFVPNAQIEDYLRRNASRKHVPMKRSIMHEIPEIPPGVLSFSSYLLVSHNSYIINRLPILGKPSFKSSKLDNIMLM